MPDFVAPALLASFFYALGGVLQKHGMATRLPDLHYQELVSRRREFVAALRSRIWLLGFAVLMLGAPLSIQALSWGDVSTVKPLMRVELVFVVLLGVGVLRERLCGAEWLGIALLTAGVFVLAVGAGDPTSVRPSTAHCALLAVTALAAVGALLGAHQRWPRRLPYELTISLGAGLLMGVGDVLWKSGTAVVASELGGFDVTRPAALAALFSAPEVYLGLSMDLSAFFLVQAAYSRGRVSVIAPATAVGATLLTVLLGSAVLQEQLSAARGTGVAAIVLGALSLSARQLEAAAAIPARRAAPGR